jgi:hypothetical protein
MQRRGLLLGLWVCCLLCHLIASVQMLVAILIGSGRMDALTLEEVAGK